MVGKFLAFIAGMSMTVLTNTAAAQESAQSQPSLQSVGAVVQPIRKGQLALFDGVLYSPLAAAQVIVERDAVPQKIKIEVDRATGTLAAKLQFQIDLDKAQIEADKKVAAATYAEKDKEIAQLEKLNEDQAKKLKHEGWRIFGGVTGGLLVGAVITTAIVFGVNQASK